MAGYSDDFSRSNNAIAAERDGRLPLTRAAKAAKVPAELIKSYLRPCEWHHVSGWYNRVDYYDVSDIRIVFGLAPASDDSDAEPDAAAIAALAAWRPTKADGERHEGCSVEWLDWHGTRNHPRAEERRAEGVAVTVKGRALTIHLPAGDVSKRLGARGLVVRLADGRLL